jgi:3-deoxy-D-manno-octulosonic-acid transferase
MRHLYSTLLILLLPLILLRMLWRSRRAPAYRRRLGERLGIFPVPPDARPLLWIHAVSLGETLAARPLIEHLLEHMPGIRLAVTTTTPTGSEQVQRLFGERVFHVYAPWDTPGAVARCLARLRPRALVLMETELWPNLLHQCGRAGCRVMLANARLSARSAAGYARFPGLTRPMLASLDLIAAQGEADRARFIELGARPEQVTVCGSIKFDLDITPALRDRAQSLRAAWALAQRPVIVAASTHEPEEALVLAAFARLRATHPDALLMLAPRHPERFDDVAALCEAGSWRLARRSAGEGPAPETAVYLLDSLGELLLFFGLADVAVIGGSFIDRGGHNPLEAAAWGVPVLCGPSMFNFEDIAGELESAGGLARVADSEALAGELALLLDDPAQCRRRGESGAAMVAGNRGAGEALLRLLQGLLRSPSGIPGG